MSEYTPVDNEIVGLRTQSVPLSLEERELIGIGETVEFTIASLWLLKDIAETALSGCVSVEAQWLESYEEAWHISRGEWSDPACDYEATNRTGHLLDKIESLQQNYRQQLGEITKPKDDSVPHLLF